MEGLYRTHDHLLRTKGNTLPRNLFSEINEEERLIGIVGPRGIGKTTFLLDWGEKKFGNFDKRCLYVNLNQFMFTTKRLVDFSGEFVANGGKLLLLDQIFKYPEWQTELKQCIEQYPSLQIVYTCSMTSNDCLNEMPGKCFFLKGLSLREFMQLKTGISLPSITFDEIIHSHRDFSRTILESVNPCNWMQSYLHHGYYPLFLENRNYSENLLKNINMMLEVDLMYIRNIDQRLLPKLRKLLYLIALEAPSAVNVSRLAQAIGTSRTTVTNYITAMADAHLISLVERQSAVGVHAVKTPSMILLENSNLCYVLQRDNIFMKNVILTFFHNQLSSMHQITSPVRKGGDFVIDNTYSFNIEKDVLKRKSSDKFYATDQLTIGKENVIPLWIFGFLY